MHFVVCNVLRKSMVLGMALKEIKIKTNSAKPTKSSDIVVIDVPGNIVSSYNRAVIDLKDAEARKAEFDFEVKELGLPELFEQCINNPTNPPSSVKLRDESGAVVRVTSMDKYSVFDAEVADPVFSEFGADINEFAQFTAKAKFDASVFLAKKGTAAGDEGNFSEKIFNAYRIALDRATAELVRSGMLPPGSVSPLSSEKVATVKPDFHKRRWEAFPSAAKQARISAVIRNTVTLNPVVE